VREGKVKVEIKNLKLAGGEETPRFEASLYIDGKKAGIVSNGGNGGCHDIWINEPELRKKFYEAFEDVDAEIYKLLDEEEHKKMIKKYVKKGFKIVALCKRNKQVYENRELFLESFYIAGQTEEGLMEYAKKIKSEYTQIIYKEKK
jgi:hypothetical protein